MNKLLIIIVFVASYMTARGEKLEKSVTLQETKWHSFCFDKESLHEDPYFSSSSVSGLTKFCFDGETFTVFSGENAVTNNIKKFIKTEDDEDNIWRYLITFDDCDPFPICVEIEFLPDNTAILKYPMMDIKTGSIYGYNISECIFIK